MARKPMKVYVRLRPTANKCSGFRTSGHSISLHQPKKRAPGPDNSPTHFSFQFDGLFDNDSQEEVFTHAAAPLVDGVLQGCSATIFTYGPTSSGKTFTMSGGDRLAGAAYAQRGITPRAVSAIFQRTATTDPTDRTYAVSASAMEIYGETLYDLLADDPARAGDVQWQEGPTGVIDFKGLSRKAAGTEEDALRLFFAAEAARISAPHAGGRASSRSHFLFTLHVEARTPGNAEEPPVASHLALVDLAGVERLKSSASGGQGRREAMAINRSLAALDQAVNALARKVAHVPYRQSRLTAVLKPALSGATPSAMIATVWPEEHQLEATLSTLRFAGRIACLTAPAGAPRVESPSPRRQRLGQEVQELRAELALRDTLAGRGAPASVDSGEAEQRGAAAAARAFMEGHKDAADIPMPSLRAIVAALTACREYHRSAAAAPAAPPARGTAGAVRVPGASGEPRTEAHVAAGAEQDSRAGNLVGRSDPSCGAAFGVAPLDARPPCAAVGRPGAPLDCAAPAQRPRAVGAAAEPARPPALAHVREATAGASRAAAFELFKRTHEEGAPLAEALRQAQAAHRDAIAQHTARAREVNALARDVKQLEVRLEDRVTSFPAHAARAEVEREPEIAGLIASVREHKQVYQATRTALGELAATVLATAAAAATGRRQLLTEFEAWYKIEGIATAQANPDLDADEQYALLEQHRLVALNPGMVPYVNARRALVGTPKRLRGFRGDKAKAYDARRREQAHAINQGGLRAVMRGAPGLPS